ncbi:MAG TPA: hypothetical protein VMT81_03580 [Candidatus Paceibacterota bacterium]|nr:hypothetical protein [Candidatus Paceibacterota bacterium]
MNKNLATGLISTAVAIVVFGIAYAINASLLGIAWIILGTLLTVAIALIAIRAGFVVLKSLFLIAAELSLLIFIGQSFCAAGVVHTRVNDEALKSLVFLGLAYIVVAFVQGLYAAIKEHYEKEIGSAKHSFRKAVTLGLFPVFAGIFLLEIYLVVKPIILGLCVYR